MRPDAVVANDPLGAVTRACHEPFLAAWDAADDKVAGGLTEVVRTAMAAHAEAVQTAGLAAEAPQDARERSSRLVAYGREVASDVLKPIQKYVEVGGPAAAIGRVFTDAWEQAVQGCRDLPRHVSLPWPDDALAITTLDSENRKVGKVLARLVSDARRGGEARPVALRAVAVRHLSRVVAPSQGAPARAALRVWAEWMGELETALAEWADASLPVLFSAEAMSATEAEDVAWGTVAEAAEAFEAALGRLADWVPHKHQAASGRAAIDRAAGVLSGDLGLAGSFLHNPKVAVVEPGGQDLGTAVRLRVEWESQILSRMRLHTSLFAILSGASSVQARLAARMTSTCVEPTGTLPDIAKRIDAIADGLERGGTPGPADFEPARAAAAEAITEALGYIPNPDVIEEMVSQGANATVEALQAMVRQVPANLVLHPVGTPAGTARGVDTRTLPLQAMAGQAFDALRMERIRTAAFGVVEALKIVCADAGRLPEVVDFGFQAAEKEISEAAAAAEAGEGDSDGAEGAACEAAADLACEALRRSAESLRGVPAALEGVILDTRDDVAEEVAEGCEALFERAGARRVQAQLLAARSRFSDLRVGFAETVGPLADRAVRIGRLQWTRMRRTFERGLRWVAGVFGEEPVMQARSSRTIRTLAAADVEGQSAPLVYQKLFTLDPISDPGLLVARDSELADVLTRWGRWTDVEDSVPTLVIGRAGSGVSSFINAAATRISADDGSIVVVPIIHRVYGEASLAGALAEAFKLPPTESLDDLARAVLGAPAGTIPDAMAIDGMEHVYLRTPGGTDLTERLLTFMSETASCVFWIAGLTTSAWQLVQKSEPTAVSQVDRIELAQLTATQLCEAVMRRHGRSGLQVRFEEPEGRQLLKRRLRRRRGPEAQQELLKEDFFEQLHRASLGTLRLALFQWLQFAEFDTADGVVRMKPVDRPDFSLLEALDLTQNFTLKAFLEHGTLTLGEHDAVFRIPRHESYQIFESLGNRNLIEPIDRKVGERRQSEIVEGLRYRVRPLLTGAVIAHLERRNIVH